MKIKKSYFLDDFLFLLHLRIDNDDESILIQLKISFFLFFTKKIIIQKLLQNRVILA